jgi:hypothetical protein
MIMSTRATIKFQDGDDAYYAYRHCDGFPENVEEDLYKLTEEAKGRWSEPQLSLLVTLFLTMNRDYRKDRLPNYEITESFHGDESCRYYCKWDSKNKG